MTVRLTSDAETDLEAIGDYIARDNPLRAVSFVQELRTCCQELAALPHAWPLVPRYEMRGVRRRVYGDFLIFYRPESEGVTILRVLHGAMDYAAIILEP